MLGKRINGEGIYLKQRTGLVKLKTQSAISEELTRSWLRSQVEVETRCSRDTQELTQAAAGCSRDSVLVRRGRWSRTRFSPSPTRLLMRLTGRSLAGRRRWWRLQTGVANGGLEIAREIAN
nr:hypothetical protein Iba_chr13cCG9030 [Ipomoea batatas]